MEFTTSDRACLSVKRCLTLTIHPNRTNTCHCLPNLKKNEELPEDYPFVRIHHSRIVNIDEVEKYVKGEGGYLIISDGSSIDASRSRKESLLKKLSLK